MKAKSYLLRLFLTSSLYFALADAFVTRTGRSTKWTHSTSGMLLASSPSVADTAEVSSNVASTTPAEGKLTGCVCVVTGASRGIGKGIAIELGKEGATVYVTGTSAKEKTDKLVQGPYTTNEDVGGPGTVQDTADAVTSAGGVGIPVLCNHADDEQIKQLFEQVEDEQGRLDILINNVFRVPEGGADSLSGKFWTLGMGLWDVIHDVGVRSHYAATIAAIPLMLRSRDTAPAKISRPFIGMISSFGGNSYTFNVPYGVAKGAVDRMAKDMAIELKNEDVCVTSFYPGLVMTERTERMVESGEWERDVGLPLDNAESPRLTGRAIVAVATDANNMEKTGTFQVVAELADEYDFTDVNGKKPPSIRSLKFLLPSYGFDEETRKKVPDWMIPDWKLPFWVMAQGRPPDKDDEPRVV